MVTVKIKFDGGNHASKETLRNAFNYARAFTASFNQSGPDVIEWSIVLYRHKDTRLIEVAANEFPQQIDQISQEYLASAKAIHSVDHFEIRVNVKRQAALSKAFQAAAQHADGLVVAMSTRWLRVA